MLLKPLKLLIALALLPLAWAISETTWLLLQQMAPASTAAMTPELGWFLGGFLLWLLLFFALPLPVRSYVLAHELSHAVWALCMGARVSGLKITDKGGQVSVSKNNFLITLAPYFFPFYSVLTLMLWGLLSLWWNVSTYMLFFIGLLGLTWSFHLTFTLKVLGTRQPDVLMHGRIFSYTVIYLLNVLTMLFSIALVTQVDLSALWNDLYASVSLIYSELPARIEALK